MAPEAAPIIIEDDALEELFIKVQIMKAQIFIIYSKHDRKAVLFC